MDRSLSVLITVFLFLFTGSALAADCEKLIVTGHPSYPPVAWKEGNRIVGASLKMVEMIAQDLGLKVESKFMGSWEDAQEAIRKGTANIIFGIYYNDVRAAYMNYVKPAYMSYIKCALDFPGKNANLHLPRLNIVADMAN